MALGISTVTYLLTYLLIPTLSPQTLHLLNHRRWCHLANKLKPYCKQAQTIRTCLYMMLFVYGRSHHAAERIQHNTSCFIDLWRAMWWRDNSISQWIVDVSGGRGRCWRIIRTLVEWQLDDDQGCCGCMSCYSVSDRQQTSVTWRSSSTDRQRYTGDYYTQKMKIKLTSLKLV